MIVACLSALSLLGGKLNAMWNLEDYQSETQRYIEESRIRAERQDTLIEQQAQLIQMFHGAYDDR